jgi:geranylgeranyl diphosphate synthase type II
MNLPVLEVLRDVRQQPARRPQEKIPATRGERERLRRAADQYAAENDLVGPIGLSDLRQHAGRVLKIAELPKIYCDYATILINNALWRGQLAGIPFNRRLLLLPKCIRDSATCTAEFDEFGLVCRHCGGCSLTKLQQEAERLGYAVLIAEGSAVVMRILQTHRIEAIVGVSCLSVLEKSFPFLEAAAIPGAAVPLLHDDCKDTNVDLDWVWETIFLTSEEESHEMDLERIRGEAKSLFTRESLDALMGPPDDPASKLAYDWLLRDGKRWRPFLTLCAYSALTGETNETFPAGIRKVAAAIECFHKASLVHDDIEDDDDTRYGQPTLHAEHGVPIALNAGDLLIGEGYRLLIESGAPADRIAELVRIAADGHRTLCLGQGAELAATPYAGPPGPSKPNDSARRAGMPLVQEPLAVEAVLKIFCQKTAPAFEVALRLAAAYVDSPESLHELLTEYSTLLGVAYQIRDDMDDWFGSGDPDDLTAGRPSLIIALAWEHADEAERAILLRNWRGNAETCDRDEIAAVFDRLGIGQHCQRLYLSYRERAIRSLRDVESQSLKSLLRRVIGKIFNELTCEDWRCEPQ